MSDIPLRDDWHLEVRPGSGAACRSIGAVEDGEVEKLVLTQRKPRPRGGRVGRALEPAGARAGGARLEVEQEAEHPADFE